MMQKKISSEIPRNNKKDKIDQKRDKTTWFCGFKVNENIF